MGTIDYQRIVSEAKESFPKRDEANIKYGTAGFRAKADGLQSVMFRMGLVAALRSKSQKAAVGAMITASHNPAPDNGIKLIEPRGEMLVPAWEAHATRIANATDDDLALALRDVAEKEHVDAEAQAIVFVGRDTRPSSLALQKAVEKGVALMGGRVKDLGEVSTPILHFVVTCFNDNGYGEPSEEGYFAKLSAAFVALRRKGGSSRGLYEPRIAFDGANGVGAAKMTRLLSRLEGTLEADVFNAGEGELNFMCGTDYVKSNQRPPQGVPLAANVRCVCVDGDADRVIYWYVDDDDGFHLLDGDKIATLVAAYLKTMIEKAGLDLQMGLVQTAYANGASTDYITKKLGVPVACTCTGVKHLHHCAQQFDVGVYFEANGHGTVVFSKKARTAIETEAKGGKNESAEELLHVMHLINETVGDALSDMLLVETVLLANGWSVRDWDRAYTDLPNRLVKVTVADRSVIATTNAERTCVAPPGLQAEIDALAAQYDKGRAFVRPSGTEDVVRVYAEAATPCDADALARRVARATFDLAGGRGRRPSIS